MGEPLPLPKSADHRPTSDVSAAVGLVGLAGLLAWVVFCRNWPAIAGWLALDAPRVPMAGPYAALAALVFSAGPMVLWAVLVDKVHLRPSTGIDWRLQRPLVQAWQTTRIKLAGLWATWLVIGIFYCLARWYWVEPYRFAMQLLGVALVPMVLASVPYVLWLDRVLVNPRDGAWHFGAMLMGRAGWERDEILRHGRAWAVKGFFTAFMLSILPGGFADFVAFDWRVAAGNPVQLSNWLTNGLFMIDVQIGTVGYILTLRPLDGHIRSANPWLGGWVAALICYPPFVLMGNGGPLDYHVMTADWSHWLAGHPALLWLWAGWLVFLTGIYAWATLAFGYRFSNLTYRGVLTHGPYAVTRHPAYLSKNLFWWSATLPMLVTNHSMVDAIRNTVILAAVSGVYYWRAKTEERHLSQEDAKYLAYSLWMERHGAITSRLRRAIDGISAILPAGRKTP